MNVLSNLLDSAARNRLFGHQSSLQKLRPSIPELCRRLDGTNWWKNKICGRHSKGVWWVRWRNLSANKYGENTVYLGGLAESSSHEITTKFKFTTCHLPVKYIDLQLTTKCMNSGDYLPLLGDIKKINSWKSRFLFVCGKIWAHKICTMEYCRFLDGCFQVTKCLYQGYW